MDSVLTQPGEISMFCFPKKIVEKDSVQAALGFYGRQGGTARFLLWATMPYLSIHTTTL